MDLNLQRLAERVLRESIGRISPQLQGSLLSLDPITGDVLAVAGGTDFKQIRITAPFLPSDSPAQLSNL